MNVLLLSFICVCLLFVLFKLLSSSLKKKEPIIQNNTHLNESTIEIAVETEEPFIEQNIHIDNFKEEEIIKSENTFIEKEMYFYKVTEDLIGFDDVYPPITLFNRGNLLREKFNAFDWYNRRKDTLALKQQISNSGQSSHILKLFLVQKNSNDEEKEYLLIDESGVKNEENTLFEGRLLDSMGYNKLSDPYMDNNSVMSKNSFLHSNPGII